MSGLDRVDGIEPSHNTAAPGSGTGCVTSTQCYDLALDPKGERYDGCVSTTESGTTCQVEKFLNTLRESVYHQDWGINDNPYKALWRESNNCRNPNKFLRPWYQIPSAPFNNDINVSAHTCFRLFLY